MSFHSFLISRSWNILCEMNFTYLCIKMLNSKHHIQLGPDDSVSFPVVYGGAKQDMLWFFVNSNFWTY